MSVLLLLLKLDLLGLLYPQERSSIHSIIFKSQVLLNHNTPAQTIRFHQI